MEPPGKPCRSICSYIRESLDFAFRLVGKMVSTHSYKEGKKNRRLWFHSDLGKTISLWMDFTVNVLNLKLLRS